MVGELIKYGVSGAIAVFVSEWVGEQDFIMKQDDAVKKLAKYGTGGVAMMLAHKLLGPKITA